MIDLGSLDSLAYDLVTHGGRGRDRRRSLARTVPLAGIIVRTCLAGEERK